MFILKAIDRFFIGLSNYLDKHFVGIWTILGIYLVLTSSQQNDNLILGYIVIATAIIVDEIRENNS